MTITAQSEWVPLKEYCDFTGEVENTVHARVKTGVWERGVILSSTDARTSFINIQALLKWVTSP